MRKSNLVPGIWHTLGALKVPRVLLFFVVGTTSISRLYAEENFFFTSDHEEAYRHYLALEFEAAYGILEKTDAKNGNTIYLKNYYDWFQVLIEGNESELKRFTDQTDKRLETIDGYDQSSPYFYYLQGELYLQRGIAKLYFEKQFSAVWDIRKAYKLLQKNHEKHPNFLPHHKSLGTLEVLLGAVPEKYQWALSLIGLKGAIPKGIKKLEYLRKSNSPFAAEAGLFYAFLQTHVLGEEQEAVLTLQKLAKSYPEITSIIFGKTIVLLRAQRHEKARLVLDQLQYTDKKVELPHWEYLRGEVELHTGNFAKGKAYYLNFLEKHKGKHFIKDTYYKIFLADWLSGNQQAGRWLKKVRTAGATLSDADRHALRFAENEELPNPELMKARLLTDGGKYENALQIVEKINPKDFTRPRDRTEWWYRKARILHQQGKVAEATRAYKTTISEGGELPFHFAANACLQLGYIFQSKNDITQAKNYFEQVEKYDNHAYADSLKQKAKTALAQLE